MNIRIIYVWNRPEYWEESWKIEESYYQSDSSEIPSTYSEKLAISSGPEMNLNKWIKEQEN